MSDKKNSTIVVVGAGGVGKSSCTILLVNGTFSDEYNPTVEDSYTTSMRASNGKRMTCDIVDTSGQDEYKILVDMCLQSGDGFFLVYSLTDPESLRELEVTYQRILRAQATESVPCILVGNKCDLGGRKVTALEGRRMAQRFKCQHIETSAKTNIGVVDAFRILLEKVQFPNGAASGGCCEVQ